MKHLRCDPWIELANRQVQGPVVLQQPIRQRAGLAGGFGAAFRLVHQLLGIDLRDVLAGDRPHLQPALRHYS